MPLLDLQAGAVIPLPERGGIPESAHVIDADSIAALNAALVTGRPLLVRGEPGTGKSQLARAAAEALGRAFLSHAVDSRTETRDLLWTVDAVARLAEAQILGAMHGHAPDAAMERIAVRRFLQPGPLWWAFDWASAREQAKRAGVSEPLAPEGWDVARGTVLLIDEIDKADPGVPNGLLDALGHGRFDVPGTDGEPVVMDRARRPLVVITTNEERALPDAFLRRCLVLHLALPAERAALVAVLIARGRAHFSEKKCADAVLREAAELLATDREKLRERDLAPPGLAEYIDLLLAVTEQRTGQEAQIELLRSIAKFALRKHPPELIG
jgi:MoxR-like ATPase